MNKIDGLVRLQREIRGSVLMDKVSLGLYATDASMYQFMPIAVVHPLDQEDVIQAVRLCSEYGLPMIARGAGTSLTGQSIGEAVIIDVSKYLIRIVALDLEHRWVRAEPGIVCQELNNSLKNKGLHFAPDPVTLNRANIGGMISNNAAGMRSVVYGMTIDHVLELKVVLSTGDIVVLGSLTTNEEHAELSMKEDKSGEIYRFMRHLIEKHRDEISHRFPKVARHSGGYPLDAFLDKSAWNMARIIVGSEGTLGIVLEAKLKLEPLPAKRALCIAHFASLREALLAAEPIVSYMPSAVELIDGVILGQAKVHPLTQHACNMIDGDPAAVLIIEVQGDSLPDVGEGISRISEMLIFDYAAYAAPFISDEDAMARVWEMRSSALGLMTTLTGTSKPIPYIEDAAVPLASLADYVEDVLAVCRRYGQSVSMFGHVSVGLMHIRPLHDLHRPEDISILQHIQGEVFELVLKYGGSWSGEHGDGIVRGGFNQRFFGEEVYSAFRDIKYMFDPKGLMNPGKVVASLPVNEHLRFGYQNLSPAVHETRYKFQRQGGLPGAVEQCTGVGACRKLGAGVMCPSYMVTRDERESTRARANALRLAITGQFGSDHRGYATDELRKVFDLCLSCKGCNNECPNGIDISRMKSELLYQYQKIHGKRFRSLFFGYMDYWAPILSSYCARMANGLLNKKVVRGFLDRYLEIDLRRPLPEFSREPLSQWFANRKKREVGSKVILFNDTYLEAFQPQVGRAAVEVLEAAGYQVVLASVGGSQRSALSLGLLDQAARQGASVFRSLATLLQDGTPILVCEPSCATALKDDLPDLLEDASLTKHVADRVVMIDLFLERESSKGYCALPWVDLKDSPNFFVHPHCHQSGLGGVEPLLNLLSNIPGAVVEASSAGCCGMAGSFGYEKEHYDFSVAVAEGRLLPKLRKLGADVQIIANGFSCRHQIQDLSGKAAYHSIEVIRNYINAEK